MSRVFIVSSVYQLFNAINLTDYENRYGDTTVILMQSNQKFENSIDVDYLKSFFKDVRLVNYEIKTNKLHKFLYVIKNVLAKSAFDLKIITKFDEVFISGTEVISKLMACKVMSKDAHIYYYEDGLASYTTVLDKRTKKWNDMIFRFYKGDILKRCEKIYVYEPGCVCNNSYNIVVERIPKLQNRDVRIIDLAKVELNQINNVDTKVLFLSTWFESEQHYKLQKDLCQIMLKYFGNDYCSIKLHPNEVNDVKLIENVKYIKGKGCFEISNYYNDFGKSVLISIVSTACISPKLVYNQEPYIIYLYKIYQNEFGMWPSIDETILKMISSYSNTKRVFIPNSIAEYENVLKNIKEVVLDDSKVAQNEIES